MQRAKHRHFRNRVDMADHVQVRVMKRRLRLSEPELNKIVEKPETDLTPWIQQIAAWKKSDPFKYDAKFPGILPQEAIHELWKLTQDREAIISVGVGQHQMWAAQFYKLSRPQTWLSSSGLGNLKSLRTMIWKRTLREDSMAVPDSSPSPWLTCGSPMENRPPSTCTG